MKTRILPAARLSFPLATAIAALLAAPSARAVTKTWVGTTADWGTAGNWSASGVPAAADDGLFTSTPANKSIYLGTAARSINTLTFDSTTGSTPYTINTKDSLAGTTTRVLTVGAGGIVVSAGSHTIKGNGAGAGAAAELTLTNNSAFNVASGSTLTFEAKPGGTSTNNLSKTGLGTLVIKNNNSGGTAWNFSGGGFTVSAGTLDLATAGASGLSGNIFTVASGGSLKLSASGVWTSTTGSLTLNGTSSASGALYASATSSLSATTVLLATTSSIGADAAQTLTLGSAITGTGTAGLNKVGSGSLTLSTANTYSGNTLVSAGKITLGNALALQNSAYDTASVSAGLDVAAFTTPTLGGLTGSVDLSSALITGYGGITNLTLNPQTGITQTYSGIISNGAAGMALTKSGAGAQVLSGASTYTGSTAINTGALVLNNATALGGNSPGVNGTSSISMAAGTTLRSNFIGAGAGFVDSFVYAPITLSGAGDANLQIGAGNSTAPSPAVVFNLNGAIGGSITNLVFSAINNLNNSDSTFILGAAGTYSGNTTLTTGNSANRINVKAGVANALPVTTVLTMAGGAGTGSGRTVQYDLNGNPQTLAGLTNGGVVPSLRNQRVHNSGALATLTINNTSDFTYGGVNGSQSAQITGNLALTKNGAGKFTLAAGAGNSFSGSTTILGGILNLGHATSIQNSVLDTTSSIAGDPSNGLQTTVTTLTLGGLAGNKNLAGVFTTTAGGYDGITALTLNPGTGVTPSYSGNITDATVGMTLTKTGAGTQTLSGAISHTGTTTINAGILTLDYSTQDNSKLSDTAALILGNGTLSLTGGTHAESVLSTTLTAGTVSHIASSGAAPLQLNTITLGDNASIDFAAPGIATTDNLNNAYGILGAWATVNGSLAVNSTNTADGLITAAVSSDVTRLDGGLQVIPDGSTNNIRIIEGTGIAANITLGAATTTINTLFQSASGGTSPATIDSGTQTLRTNAVIVASGTGSLTVGNGTLAAANAGGVLELNNSASQTSGTELTVNSVIDNNTTASSLTKTGTGLTTLTAANTFSGVTTVNGGALRITNAGALGTTAGGLVVNGTSTGSTNNARLELSGGITVTGETATLSGVGNFFGPLTSVSGVNEWAGNVILASSIGQTRLGASAGATLKVSGVVTDDGVNTLGLAVRCENATSTVILTAANNYLGDTSLIIGKLQLDGGNNRLPVGTKFSMGNSTNVVEFDLNGRNQELAGLSIISGATAANNSVNNSDIVNLSTLTVNTAAASPSTFAGLLKGNLALTKTGTDTLTLTGASTFTGGTTINATSGTLQATITQTVNALGTGPVSVGAGSTLILDDQSITNVTNLPLIGNVFTGSGLLKLQFAANTTARNTYMPNVTGFNGTIQLSNLGTTGDKWNATDVGTVAGSLIVDSGSTIMVAAGTGASFTGGITLNGAGNSEARGAIRLGGATLGGNISLASSSTINMENATAAITGNITGGVVGTHTLTLGATGSVGGSLSGNISDGAGTITVTHATGGYALTGILSQTGGVNVAGGLLTLSNPSNSYTGVTAISAVAGRSLLVTANGALGATGTGNETTVGSNGQLGLSGGITYSAPEKIIGSGTGNTGAQGVFTNLQRGFIQSVSGNNTFAGDIDVTAASRIGTQEGASLTLTGVITQTTGNILFRTGSLPGDFVTLSNAGNSFGGDSTVFTAATTGNWAGVRLGVSNGLPTNLTLSGFTGTGTGTALDLNGKNQSLNGLINGATLNIVNLDTLNASTLTLNPTADKSTTNTLVLGGGGLGTINLVKDGSFTQTLAGVNSYSGNTTVNAGTLTLGNAASPADANTGNNASTVTIAATSATLNLTYTGTDTVGQLFIGSTQQAAGTYGHTNSGATNGGLGVGALDAYFGPGTGTLTVTTGPAGYSSWATVNGAGPNLNDDHDNDGVKNGVEYFIGGPTGNTTGFTPLPGVVNTAGLLSVTWTKAAGYTGIYGTDFVVETSATLANPWAPEASPGTVSIIGNNVTYTFPVGTTNFARLKVTGP